MKPALLIVDDDPQVLQAVGIDLRHKYGDRFRVGKSNKDVFIHGPGSYSRN